MNEKQKVEKLIAELWDIREFLYVKITEIEKVVKGLKTSIGKETEETGDGVLDFAMKKGG